METKLCPKCKESKPTSEFHRNKARKDGLQYTCKPCAIRTVVASQRNNRDAYNSRNREWYRANPNASRAAHLKRKYGITQADYDALLAAQGDGCAICHNDIQRAGAARSGQPSRWFCVDHDHTTGKVRGLLCRRCNALAGWAEDTPELFKAVREYLAR